MAFEKVNMYHPDKVADRIAGAIVDLAYSMEQDPKIAVEVLIGHGRCYIIAETSVTLDGNKVAEIVQRITGTNKLSIIFNQVPQDKHLADNQSQEIRCGDNGIFKGVPTNQEELTLSDIARTLSWKYQSDGKYIYDAPTDTLIICQSNASKSDLEKRYPKAKINPLGDWTGGTDVDTGATNRKLGSDMGRAVTGGGLHGKDLSKADVSVNIYAFLKAQTTGFETNIHCAIGDTKVDGIPYKDIVEMARHYIKTLGGFEKLAEWGLI